MSSRGGLLALALLSCAPHIPEAKAPTAPPAAPKAATPEPGAFGVVRESEPGDEPAPDRVSYLFDFEDEAVGEPSQWFELDDEVAKRFESRISVGGAVGQRCLELAVRPGASSAGWVSAEWRMEVERLRGHRVRLAGRLRVSDGESRAALFLVGRDGQGVFRAISREVSEPSWGRREIFLDIPADATGSLVLMLGRQCNASAFFDELELTDLGLTGDGDVPRIAVDAQGVENLTALAELYGLVRYHHPSDEAAAADWDQVLAHAVELVESAPDAGELAARMQQVFQPLCPGLVVQPTGRPIAVPAPPPAPSASARPLAWVHLGVGHDSRDSRFWSRRSERGQDGLEQLAQRIDVRGLAGKTLRYALSVRSTDARDVRVAFDVRNPDGEVPSAHLHEVLPASSTWRRVEGRYVLPADAVTLWFAIELYGGEVWLDEVSLKADDAELLTNPGFEAVDRLAGWTGMIDGPGYRYGSAGTSCQAGKACAFIRSEPLALPPPGEASQADLPGGISVRVPLVLWQDSGKSLPRAAESEPPTARPRVITDRTTRLVAVIEAWTALRAFRPLQLATAAWSAELARALTSAGVDPDAVAFQATLDRLLRPLHDGMSEVIDDLRPLAELPVRLALVEGALDGRRLRSFRAAPGRDR